MLIAHDCASYTICNKQRPSYKTSFPQNGKCSQEEKELENSLESPLHLGEYHVVTLQKRGHQGGGQQHFQTVRALQSGADFKLGQEVKYNTSRIPVSNFNMAGYYLKPAATSQRRQSVEDWCQSVPVPCQSWSPTASLQGGNISLQGGNIYAEVSNHDYEDDSGFTEGSSDVASERKGDSLYTSSRSNSNMAVCNHKSRGPTDRDVRRATNPNVFSISKGVGRVGGNYCDDHSEQVGGHQLKFGGRGQVRQGREENSTYS